MLRIQAETVGTGASGVKKKSHRQLLDAKKGTDAKPCKFGLVIGWAPNCMASRENKRKLKQILFHCLNAFEEAHKVKRFGHVFIGP
jgi:hypothetical protein